MATSRSLGGSALTTRLPMAISPDVMFSSPAIMRSSVDLPQPDGPTSTTNSLSAMSTLTPCSTSTEPNALRTLRMSTVAIPGPHLRRARTQLERCVVGAASRVEQFPAPASIIPDRRNIKDKHRVCGKRAAVGTCSAAPALQHSTMRGQVTRRYRRSEGGIGAGNAGSRPLFVETLGPLEQADGPGTAISASGRKAPCRRFRPA